MFRGKRSIRCTILKPGCKAACLNCSPQMKGWIFCINNLMKCSSHTCLVTKNFWSCQLSCVTAGQDLRLLVRSIFSFGEAWAAKDIRQDVIQLILSQCLSIGCIVHPRVYQNFPRAYQLDGMYHICGLQEQTHCSTYSTFFAPGQCVNFSQILKPHLSEVVFPTRVFPNRKPGFCQLLKPGILKNLELLLHSNISNSDNTKVAVWRV